MVTCRELKAIRRSGHVSEGRTLLKAPSVTLSSSTEKLRLENWVYIPSRVLEQLDPVVKGWVWLPPAWARKDHSTIRAPVLFPGLIC